MGQTRQPRDHVSHVVKLYHRGIICPSEMWLSLAEALSPATATVVLESLPEDVKVQLRAVYLGCPPAAYIEPPFPVSEDEAFRAVCVQVVRWCEASGRAPEAPEGPDGLIRVRVKGGRVQEWRPWEESGKGKERGK